MLHLLARLRVPTAPRPALRLRYACRALHRAGGEQDRAASVHPADLSRLQYQVSCLHSVRRVNNSESQASSEEPRNEQRADKIPGGHGRAYLTRSVRPQTSTTGRCIAIDLAAQRLELAKPSFRGVWRMDCPLQAARNASKYGRFRASRPKTHKLNPQSAERNGRSTLAPAQIAWPGLECWREGVAGGTPGKIGRACVDSRRSASSSPYPRLSKRALWVQ